MARHEPLGRAAPGEILDTVRVRRGPDGKLHIAPPERTTTETTEVAEKPPVPDDPRSGLTRNVPPYGGA